MLSFGDSRLPLRFWDKIIPVPWTGCWLWTGALTGSRGYGSFNLGKDPRTGRQITGVTHKMTYELVHGPIVQPSQAPRIVVDHKCRERSCCNPWHLEAISEPLNVARGISPAATNKIKVACPRGHAYDTANTILYRNKRYCKACKAHTPKEAPSTCLNSIFPP